MSAPGSAGSGHSADNRADDGAGGSDPVRVGPKATEDEIVHPGTSKSARSLSLRAFVPNAITAAALCAGLTGIRFAISGDWGAAVLAVVLAGVLDGFDGRIARLLNAQSRFGAELDSLADSLSFGTAPAVIIYLWALQDVPRFGWFAALAFAISCALRLARFNAQIDVDEQPHKRAGFLTGVPAPVAAGLAFLPLYLWIATGRDELREPLLVGIWLGLIGVLMISNIATLSWASLRPRRGIRLELIAVIGVVFGGGVLLEPWWTLVVISAGYLALIPYGLVKYARIKRQAG